MILTVTLNPAVDKTVYIPGFAVNEVNRVQHVILDPGGKGINVSKSVQALGGETLCLSILGGETGSYIKSALDEMGLSNDVVWSNHATRTNMKIVDLHLGTNTDINEAGAAVSKETLDTLWEMLKQAAKPGDIVVFAGKNPPGTPENLLAQWTGQLRQMGVRVCLDTVAEPMQLAVKEKPDVIKPNLEELQQLLGKTLQTDQIVDAARELTACGVGLVAVSMGAQGAIFVTEKMSLRAKAPKVSVVSTVGAGDSMMAAITYCMEKGCDLIETARMATAVATATVQVDGSKPAPWERVKTVYENVIVETI